MSTVLLQHQGTVEMRRLPLHELISSYCFRSLLLSTGARRSSRKGGKAGSKAAGFTSGPGSAKAVCAAAAVPAAGKLPADSAAHLQRQLAFVRQCPSALKLTVPESAYQSVWTSSACNAAHPGGNLAIAKLTLHCRAAQYSQKWRACICSAAGYLNVDCGSEIHILLLLCCMKALCS